MENQTSFYGGKEVSIILVALAIPNYNRGVDILVTAGALSNRGIDIKKYCFRCGAQVEDGSHELLECPYSMMCWETTPWWELIVNWGACAFDFGYPDMVTKLKREEVECYFYICWMLWYERNKARKGEVYKLPIGVRDDATAYLYEFQKSKVVISTCTTPPVSLISHAFPIGDRLGTHSPIMTEQSMMKMGTWKPLVGGTYKLNIDAVISMRSGLFGVGAVVRDANGVVVRFLSCHFKMTISPFVAESTACLEALKWCAEKEFSSIT
ncbi:uncharacterized protein LOC133799685 [Humulus lupulus]|uniref:uncharacterized protein LOC133799685 n=1 Tax=Humulus lupulus TaxID=3486 RepID=UPI002B400B56|nr:uncharacterized protein LOC133799685 [Humulus lupulus]